MRRSVIISLAIAMGISFLCLLGLQVSYISEILDMRRIHFQEDVKRSLTQVAHQLEVDEASRYLEQGPEAMTGIATAIDSITVSVGHPAHPSGQGKRRKRVHLARDYGQDIDVG